jgi:hypothetical protein
MATEAASTTVRAAFMTGEGRAILPVLRQRAVIRPSANRTGLSRAVTTDELWTLAGIEKTDWVQRRTLKVGTCAGAPVWWDEQDGRVDILVGHDAETWDMGVTIPLATVHEILAELGEPPEVTPPPSGPTLF